MWILRYWRTGKAEATEKNLKSKSSNSSTEQDFDSFLLGDLEDNDGGPGILLTICLDFNTETCILTCHFEICMLNQ